MYKENPLRYLSLVIFLGHISIVYDIKLYFRASTKSCRDKLLMEYMKQ